MPRSCLMCNLSPFGGPRIIPFIHFSPSLHCLLLLTIVVPQCSIWQISNASLKSNSSSFESRDEIVEELCSSLLEKVPKHYEVIRQHTVLAVIAYLCHARLKALLVIDSLISKQKFKKAQIKLSEYAKVGGVVVLCFVFSNSVSVPNFTALMQNMDLEWEYEDYHRTVFALNPAFKSIFGR